MFAINSAETFIHARLGFQDLKRILHDLYLERKQLDYMKIKLLLNSYNVNKSVFAFLYYVYTVIQCKE